ncbi:fatty acid oxidation complex subunit alpha FadB [Catenovulum maritimum]|uniref:enoyl-CoA hydratase n=1 Tax=Catenovulum maritimum TaxID=1513271 RepID=A0A0J8GM94_9ALTE|nr:fatty acid oxidation complex subunit alpha FadB [Catenovulum maritimum]KMT63957.1 multifunctional fatty acid oxidation complex subunit alpha [Catenovulum maritimum]
MLYEGKNIQLVQQENGLVELIIDCHGSVNKFDKETLEEFNQAIITAQSTSGLRGLLLTSNKTAFLVGADITEFIAKFALPEAELASWIKYATDIFDRLEDLPFPTVSVITGFALGGGCETILATDYRISDDTAVIGLPEVKLGIMPGFGGTVRMSRLIGADNAMKLITTGKNTTAAECLKLGIVDAVVSKDKLKQSALETLIQAADGEFDWQQKRNQKLKPLKLNQNESLMCFSLAKAMVFQTAGKHYPAPMMAVSTIEQGARHNRPQAMEIENKNFVHLSKTSQAKALVGLFLADQCIKSKVKKLVVTPQEINNAAVLGAGIMGGGIAYQSACKNIAITLKDINQEALDLGMSHACNLLEKQVARGKITAAQMGKIICKINPSLDYASLNNADIIVEAVVENPNVKSQVLAEVEKHVNSNCVITTNTSTISIDLLAESLDRKDKFCGMHFFNPVHRMPLVEIIRSKYSSEDTINKVVQYSLAMGKSPIIVNDCPGFFVNRVLFPYLAAFNQLLVDGADFIQIDKVMEQEFGWPMGPAYLLDVVGLDTAYHAQRVMASGYPHRMPLAETNIIHELFEQNNLGQKTNSGFYLYSKDKKGKVQKTPNLDLISRLEQHGSKHFSSEEIIQRLMIPMINETILCLEENIISSAEEADMALIYGLGFPAFRGGVFRYIETLGLAELVKQADTYSKLGPCYQLTPNLRSKSETNKYYLAN